MLVPGLAAAETPARPAPPPAGTLFIAGGGLLGEDLMNDFLRRCGGDEARLVVITTANGRATTAADEIAAPWRARTAASLTLLHARSVEEANDPAFSAPIRRATGVWLMSGRQTRLTETYLGTRLLDELRAFLRRGGVIGGSSAGAAVMSDVMLAGGTLAEPGVFTGFGFLEQAIIDQHFSERGREPRLLTALQRTPERVGFGIDEATAMIVRNRSIDVIGAGRVSVYLHASAARPAWVRRLSSGDREDLTALRRAALARTGDRFPAERIVPQGPPRGSLVIVGGGRMPNDAVQKFIEAAGGVEARFVVVPTADVSPTSIEREVPWLRKAGVHRIELVHPRNRDEADRKEFADRIRRADGVWFGGGRQWRLVDAFEGTAAETAFRDVLERGGVIGGSSAGATIQGEYLVRGSPLGNTLMMAEGYERGFGYLRGAAVDQHFSQRNRGADMRLLKQTFPQLLGLGLDEATAVVVRGDRFEVVGEATVSVYPPQQSEPAVLKRGDVYDLAKFRVIQSAE